MADDFSELLELAADLTGAGDGVGRFAKKALEVTARSVRDDWRQGAEVSAGNGYTAAYPRSIFYDVEVGRGEVSAEVGPELGRPGGSAGFLEDAPGGVLASPQHAGRDALEANEPDFIRGMEIAVFDATVEAVRK